jgi:DUF1680 family protein
MYVASSITFDVAKGVAVQLDLSSTFPNYDRSPTLLTVKLVRPADRADFELALRIPAWVAGTEVIIGLNGNTSFAKAATGTYLNVTRTWRDGDIVSLSLPMELKATKYVGLNAIAGAQRFAYEWGPTLLAARNATAAAWDSKMECIPIRGVDGAEPAAWLDQDMEAMRQGMIRFVPSEASGVTDIDFVPYFDVMDESMTVYPCYV